MGTPLYQIREVLEANNVAVFSSNYNLYGDMSRRVMMLLSEFTPELTQYSIDEAFLDLSGFGEGEKLVSYGRKIVKTIGKGTGIPVTMGIAPTKTLAKVASRYGKKYKGYQGVCMIDSEEKRIKALQGFEIGDVWGIGHRSLDKLRDHGINTAWDFTQKNESFVQKLLSVTGVRTWKELRGENCINIEELPQKKSICTSRSFPDSGLSELSSLEEAVANFSSECVRKSPYAAQLLYRDNSFRLYQPFPSRSTAALYQPHHPPAGTNQRPSGTCEHRSPGTQNRFLQRERLPVQESRCHCLEYRS